MCIECMVSREGRPGDGTKCAILEKHSITNQMTVQLEENGRSVIKSMAMDTYDMTPCCEHTQST